VRLLITNDDGIESEGLHWLARSFHRDGHHVQVVAPAHEQSGAAAALGDVMGEEAFDYASRPIDGLPEGRSFALEGPPALCTWTACLGAFGPPPDCIVSGINAGLNCGRSVYHSGTVGAVLTGANFDRSGLAVSLALGDQTTHWETAARLAVRALSWLKLEPAGTLLNVNVPNVSPEERLSVRAAPLASYPTVRTRLHNDGAGRLEVERYSSRDEVAPDSDVAVLFAGDASVTLIERLSGHVNSRALSAAAFLTDSRSG